jgi:hypothetical protein
MVKISELDNILQKAISNSLNVLIIGEPGTGKTSKVLSTLEHNKIAYKYFQVNLLDPYIDLIGIPAKSSNGELEFLQQSWIENVEVLVLDELDTASNSVIKSLREIMILRSVNGKKMKNLKSVIGISNSFELLERPDLERYHLKIEVSREIDWKYFEKYLNQYPLEKLQRLANSANLTTRQLEYLLLAHSMNLLYVANIPEKTIYLAQEILSEKYVPLQKIYERCLNNEPLSEEEARNFLGSLKIILQSKHRKTKKLLGILAKIKEKFLTSFNNDSEFVQGLLGFAELRNL